jgi:hypothetical protein
MEMMKFLRNLLEPSYSRQADYNSLDDRSTHYRFLCPSCSATVSFSFGEAIRHCDSWADQMDRPTADAIKDYFEMNLVGKTPDGGWPSIFTIDCNLCSSKFMVYSGVAETSNSVYRVVIQSIAEIAQPE